MFCNTTTSKFTRLLTLRCSFVKEARDLIQNERKLRYIMGNRDNRCLCFVLSMKKSNTNRAISFIRAIVAVVVSVAHPFRVDTHATVTLELTISTVRFLAACRIKKNIKYHYEFYTGNFLSRPDTSRRVKKIFFAVLGYVVLAENQRCVCV